jgi:hypothetical protein
MGFLRRISNAATSALSLPRSIPTHVPRRATETFAPAYHDDDDDVDDKGSRASWELSDTSSVRSGSSGSTHSKPSRHSFDSSDGDESDSDDETPTDRYDMMTAHLWNTAERQGWFRDADYDGLVSLR